MSLHLQFAQSESPTKNASRQRSLSRSDCYD